MGISCPFEAAVCFSALFWADEAMLEAVPAALEVALLFFDSIRLERFRGCMDASAEVTVADGGGGGGAAVAAAAVGVAPDILPLVLLLPD